MKGFLFLFLFLTAAAGAFAQRPDTSIRLTLQRTPTGQEPFPIAVEDFKPEDNLTPAGDLHWLSALPNIIKDDLEFSLFFNVVDFDSTYKRIFAVADPTFDDWFRVGARFILRGALSFKAGEVSAQVKLIDVSARRDVMSKRFKTGKGSERRLAHTIADAVIEQLTGHKGVSSTQLAFAQQKDKTKELFVCDYDGKNLYQLTFDKSINISPAFSPDASQLIYTSYKSGAPDLWIFGLSTGKARPISTKKGLNTSAAFSPDGKKIALTLSIDGNPELYLIETSGRVISRLSYNDGIDTSPTFSPDGKYIAFTSDRSGSPQIYVADADGLNVTRLTYEGSYNASPDWSPNPANPLIAYVGRTTADEQGDFNICVISSTGGPRQVLTSTGFNENPHWSPDGFHVVFSRKQGGTNDIFTVAYDGSGLRQVTTTGNCSNPVWSPRPIQ
ncbi:MAG: Tol-Pal system beta propeller repeat protein TolB [candidate division Zixibacteria bacterium]|nr:Tol-Pal system beta propeller repeat protein TolB [candidate division Zixibacteria bacterium]